ncbi:MAG TPA: hypothetical protein VMM56_08760 [Planctomycetaceae bacterium]|nr:hypothetical protein [Planctomycetaceae bacterium]
MIFNAYYADFLLWGTRLSARGLLRKQDSAPAVVFVSREQLERSTLV